METLTKDSFSKLTKTEQVVLAINNGKDLMERQTKNFDIHLFLIERLLVEVWYKHESLNIVKVEITDKESIAKNYSNLNSLIDEFYN